MVAAGAYRHEPFTLRRRQLSHCVPAPANGCSVITEAAYVLSATADGSQPLVWRWRSLSSMVVPPADGFSTCAQGAGVKRAAADGYETFVRRRRPVKVVTPTDGRAVFTETADVPCAAADGSEHLTGRGEIINQSPAEGRSVRTKGTCLESANAQRCEPHDSYRFRVVAILPVRIGRRGPEAISRPIMIVMSKAGPPTDHRPVRAKATGVGLPTADGYEAFPLGRRRLTIVVASPAGRRAVYPQRTCVMKPAAQSSGPLRAFPSSR